MGFSGLRHIFVALLVLLSLSTEVQAAVQVRVTPATTTALAGSTLTLTVEADSVTDLGGFQFGLTYDPAKLQAVSTAINPAFDQTIVQNLANGSGLIAATVFNNAPISGAPLTLATINFTVLAANTSTISLNKVILGQVGGAEIPSSSSVATIIVDTFTITSTAGTGGNITPFGTTTLSFGTSQNYSITPNTGFHISGVSVDGTPQGSISNYYFAAVTANHTISASFAPDSVNGACDPATNGGTFATPPTTSLCSSGTASAINGTGPWIWSCLGLNGGVPASCSASLLVIADTTPPVITTFSLPTNSTSLTVPVTALSATDASGISAYLLSESALQPAGNDPSWIPATTQPTQHTFASQGTITLYAFAKDPVGNISAPFSATVTITLTDTTAPQLTYFSIPANSTSLTVPVTALTATDATGVTAYLLSESGTQPVASDPNWVPASTPPAQYTFATQGTLTLYAFARDAAGNISAPLSANVKIVLPDTTPPTITTFTMPAVSTSMTVPLSLTAVDDVLVTGYLISESAQQPPLNDPGWTTTLPTQYVFTSQGARTVYAFTRDAAGNISVPFPATATITLPDTASPIVTTFTIPANSTSLTVAVTSFTATDNLLVTGYLLSEAITATLTDNGWRTTPINSYTFASAGNKTLYAFAKDASGNISPPSTASVVITLPDTTSPTVTQFIVPTTASSLIVPVVTFTATDDTAVTGYILTTSASVPAANAAGWTSTPPSAYTFNSAGSQILYAFAKDAAGNISTSLAATVDINLPDTTAPVVTAFAIPTSSSSLTVPVSAFTAIDDVAVTGYLLAEASSPPLPSASNWMSVAPASFTFGSSGSNTVFAFAKDATGNISSPASASTVINLLAPQIAWSAPAPIVYGTPLSASELRATANIQGTFAYSPAAGAILNAGVQTLSVTFTPADSANYATTTAMTTLAVMQANQSTVSVYAPASAVFGQTGLFATASGGNGTGAYSYDASGSTACTVNPVSGAITITIGSGVCIITATRGADNNFTASAVSAPATVSLKLAIAATAATGGNITPAGLVTFDSGSTQTYAITPNTGYHIVDVKVDGFSQGAINSYTFSNITANHSIDTVFAVDTFTITATANSGGSITPAGNTILNFGASQGYSITPDAGFVLVDVKADQVSVGKVNSYQFNNISSGHNIEAVFGADGVIDPANTSGIPEIGDALMVLTAALGDANLTPEQMKKVDTAPMSNGVPQPDGKVDLLDVLVMLRRIVGLEKW